MQHRHRIAARRSKCTPTGCSGDVRRDDERRRRGGCGGIVLVGRASVAPGYGVAADLWGRVCMIYGAETSPPWRQPQAEAAPTPSRGGADPKFVPTLGNRGPLPF